MKTLYFCKYCPQTLHYSKGCNSFVGKTYVRLLARLTFVCGEHLHARVRDVFRVDVFRVESCPKGEKTKKKENFQFLA